MKRFFPVLEGTVLLLRLRTAQVAHALQRVKAEYIR
jgi:hypothetical protein